MRINNNLMALNTYNNLTRTAGAQSKSMEKLSSGLRINRAGDDAAGLAISEKMRAQIKGLDQASRNSQDGISLIQTAEGALSETQSILQRMRELAVQSSNDTNVSEDRSAIQNEIDQLSQEIDRIGNTTEFNTRKLLNGAAGIQGTSTNSGVSIVGGSATTKATGVNLDINNITAAGEASYAITAVAASTGNITVNGTTLSIVGGGTDIENAAELRSVLNANADALGITVDEATTAVVTIRTKAVGSSANLDIDSAANNITVAQINQDLRGTDADADVVGTSDATVSGATFTSSGNTLTVHGGDYDGLQFKITDDTVATATLSVEKNGTLSMQIGANEGQDMSVGLADMRASALGVNAIDISTASSAKAAITTVNDAITTVSTERAKLGAIQNRLEHTINNLNTSSENLTAAESRVRDVDMASEMMNYTKTNILQQAAQAMLAQANQAPQGVLQLLR